MINLNANLLNREPSANGKERFSVFRIRLPKGFVPCDFDKTSASIELIDESDNSRFWIDLLEWENIIKGNKTIFIHYDKNEYENPKHKLKFIDVGYFKKTCYYLKMIFEKESV